MHDLSELLIQSIGLSVPLLTTLARPHPPPRSLPHNTRYGEQGRPEVEQGADQKHLQTLTAAISVTSTVELD